MCGIAGYGGVEPLAEERARECLKRLGRRGPDHSAWKSWRSPSGFVSFLHTRLSIIDLDPRANQPMRVGNHWIIFNGELYNYVEIRKDLERRGHRFSTASDTEVLLTLWMEEGTAGFNRMEGMWALAVYNETDGSLFLSRDRFGEKPLFIFEEGEALFFASEVKGLAALRGKWPRVNGAQLRRYLVNGYKSLYKGSDTFFEGVRALPPGGWLRRTVDGKTTEGFYWTPRPPPEMPMAFEEAVAGVRERLIRSVEWRLRADVPLAFCMSGGVDSNALIGIAKRHLGYDVHGFTIVNTDRRYEERGMVEASVKELGVRHTWVEPGTDHFLENLTQLVKYHDAPVYTISYYLHWLLMEAVARHGFKISISGTAADELFTGYYDHHLFYLAEMDRDPVRFAEARRQWEREVKPFVRNPYLNDPQRFVDHPDFRDHIYLNAKTFEGYLQVPWHEPFEETHYSDNILRNRMLNELFHESIPVILHEDDANAMFFSIENRSPFLDRSLFEFSLGIPTRHMIQNGRAKAVLREAVRGLAPDSVLDNPRKVGFNAPVQDLLDTKDPEIRERILEKGPLFDYVRRDKVHALLDQPSFPNSESKFLFYVLNAKLFLEEFNQ